jgi:large subunit ribosomal protein L30
MKLKITLHKSPTGRLIKQIRTVEALGLRKVGQSVVHEDVPSVRGQVFVVKHMVSVEEIDGE